MIESFASVSITDLQEMDSAATLVLTVNNRQARRIVAQLSAQLTQVRRVMTLPDILPLSAWLRQAGNSLSFRPEAMLASHTVDAFGARILWQDVIAEVESDRALLDVTQAARLAMEADRLMSEWLLVVRPEHETSDYQRFRVWREQYRAKLLRMDAEDSALSNERVYDAIKEADARFPFDTVVLAGFNELSPRFSSVLDAMRQRGIRVLVLPPERFPACRVQRVAAPDPDSEWRCAAQWAAARLRDNPEGRYAIVAARLETDAALAHRVLREALRTTDDAVIPYNVAVARSLADWPLVRAALAWLNVLKEFSQKKACGTAMAGEALLAGACAGHLREASGRAMIDALWRKRAEISLSDEDFHERLAQLAPELAFAWKASMEECARQENQAAAEVWAGTFRRALQSLGFPGQVALGSHAYQVLEAFDQALDRLGRQTTAVGRIGFGLAIHLLSQLALETPFQPQRDPAARLDVLGILESEGGRWDGVWVLGLTDEILPAVPKPNPFIPLATLRQANAPRATPERELQWARSMYDALLHCAPSVWISHAQYEGERELRPSPYIASLPALEWTFEPLAHVSCQLETLVDEQGPALLSGTTTHGGIGVIDTQSRNPLWAFVKYRLGASEMTDYADVADQNARGLFLHRAIELVWLMARDQVTLQRMHDEGRLELLVEQSVRQAAQEYLKDYGRVLKQLETARAVSLLDDWLMRELGRKPFIVRDLEKTFLWSYGPLELTVRLDRIDEFADGRLAVIDYKTGSGKIDAKSDWMRQRPVNLQLPFYSAVLASGDASVAALVLARLHAKKIEFQGLADQDYGFDGLDLLADWPDFAGLSWTDLMSRWRGTIEHLAQEYSAGVATNRSLHPADLDYCDVLPFLRLNQEDPRVDQTVQ